jgi:hypothetical protein
MPHRGWIATLTVGCIVLACSEAIEAGAGSLELSEPAFRFWDVTIKALAGVVGVTGAWIVITKYLLERRKENIVAMLEAQKPFREKRQSVYYEI